MSNARNRREASKCLGLEFQKRYAALVEANGSTQVAEAAVMLGALFNENIEFVIWVMKEFGGCQQMPFEHVVKEKPLPTPKFLTN